MNSCIYHGYVSHARLQPVGHTFRYPVYFFGLDLAELPHLPEVSRLFGHNRRRPLAVHDQDYLDASARPITEKLQDFLSRSGLPDATARVFLVTAARYWNYVFNPVSFYYCFNPAGQLRCTVAEVNNTFQERHLYILPARLPVNPGEPARFEAPKAFHVSPFNDLQGTYAFSFSPLASQLAIDVNIVREGREVFRSRLEGSSVPFTPAHLRRTLMRYPLTAALTVPRIVAQAGRLYFQKRLPVFTKPVPQSNMTIRTAPPTAVERLCQKPILRLLERVQRGRFDLTLPDGTTRTLGGQHPGIAASAHVRDYQFFRRLARDGDIGLGESYMAGEWTTPDLTATLSHLIDNREFLDDANPRTAVMGRAFNRLLHLTRPNTPGGSRKNIAAHYDLSNEFFAQFLDPSMLYSSAVYASPSESLESAQQRKLDLLIAKLRIQPEHHVLEIGSGWGAMAIALARQTGCRVTSITVSEQQLALATQRVREAGLADRVEITFCDYRHIEGTFDRIVSIEMLEAVGHEFLGDYFAAADRVLKPDGLFALQVITIPDQRYDAYRATPDWIQKHIFPGGHLPSLAALADAMTRRSTFYVEHLENIGIHYARTLRQWRERFQTHADAIRGLGYDEVFMRKWNYYFCYCEAAFATRTLNNLHLVLSRPGNRSLDR